MGNFKYSVWTRYETYSKEGKIFTKWFLGYGDNIFDTEADANEKVKEMKEFVASVDKATKLKHEFEVRYIDIDELPKPKPKRPRGRPKKNAEA